MELDWNASYINLSKVLSISRGNVDKLHDYLKQFCDLIPERMRKLEKSLAAKDRHSIRQTLHNMSPQLQFFGVPDVVKPINRLELEYKTIPMQELNSIIKGILDKLTNALIAVKEVIRDIQKKTKNQA